MVAEKFIDSYITNQLRLAIHKSQFTPIYIVSINSKQLGRIAATHKLTTAFYDLILTNFHCFNIVFIIYFHFETTRTIVIRTVLSNNLFSLIGNQCMNLFLQIYYNKETRSLTV
jgi:hypothetical protein